VKNVRDEVFCSQKDALNQLGANSVTIYARSEKVYSVAPATVIKYVIVPVEFNHSPLLNTQSNPNKPSLCSC